MGMGNNVPMFCCLEFTMHQCLYSCPIQKVCIPCVSHRILCSANLILAYLHVLLVLLFTNSPVWCSFVVYIYILDRYGLAFYGNQWCVLRVCMCSCNPDSHTNPDVEKFSKCIVVTWQHCWTSLQALSKRIHYGKFVAEAKFQASPDAYEAAIKAQVHFFSLPNLSFIFSLILASWFTLLLGFISIFVVGIGFCRTASGWWICWLTRGLKM